MLVCANREHWHREREAMMEMTQAQGAVTQELRQRTIELVGSAQRLEVLKSYQIAQEREEAYDLVALNLLSSVGAPLAAIGLVTPGKVTYKAIAGADLDEVLLEADLAPCSYAMVLGHAFSVPDLTQDPVLGGNEMFRARGIRSYAGVPIIDSDGVSLGAVCVFDTEVRHFGEGEIRALDTSARQVAAMLELRRANIRLTESLRIQEHKTRTVESQHRNMSMISRGEPLGDILAAVVADAETICGVSATLSLLPNPQLGTSGKVEVLDLAQMRDARAGAGRCVETGEPVVEEDADGASWSWPIRQGDGTPRGALTFRYAGDRTTADSEVLTALTAMVDLAVARSTAHQHLVELATNDPLTGVINRNALTGQVAGTTGALVQIDLDRFKQLNELHGSAVGDATLITVARQLADMNPCWRVGRIGGDEFAMFMPGANEEEAMEVARTLTKRMADPIMVNGRPTLVNASAGVCTYQDPVEGLRQAAAAADEAKRAGGGVARAYTPELRDAGLRRSRLESALRQELEEPRGLELAYQAEMELSGGKITGYEALARWKLEGEWVSPVEFVPVAEECGLVERLGEWVLTTALSARARWNTDARVWVNISPSHLAAPGFVDAMANALKAAGLGGDALGIEVTEEAAVTDMELTRTVLTGVRALGVQVAIDDFGTGYSSLTQLKNLPADVLKLDRSFVSDFEGADRHMVQAVVVLAHALNLKVLAEGVETSEQLGELRGLGCDSVQGYHIAKPKPERELFS